MRVGTRAESAPRARRCPARPWFRGLVTGVLVLAFAAPPVHRAGAGPPRAARVQGEFRYRLRGPGASLDGIAYWILMTCEIPVMMVGITRVVDRILRNPMVARKLGRSTEDVHRYLRGELPIECGALPFATRYSADITFELARDAKGEYRLVSGQLVYTSDNTTSLAYDGGSIRDRFHGSGGYTLDPARDAITLTFDYGSDPPLWTFEVSVSPPEAVEGRSVWSFAGVAEVVAERKGSRGIVRGGVKGIGTIPPFPYLDTMPRRYIGYVLFGTLDEVPRQSGAPPTPMLASVGLLQLLGAGSTRACDSFVIERTETFRTASGAQTTTDLKARAPFQCIQVLRWDADAIEDGARRYRDRLLDNLLQRDSYLALQQNLKKCDREGGPQEVPDLFCTVWEQAQRDVDWGLDSLAEDCERIATIVNTLEPPRWQFWRSEEVPRKPRCDQFLECVQSFQGAGAARELCRALQSGPEDFCQIVHETVLHALPGDTASNVQMYRDAMDRAVCLDLLYPHPNHLSSLVQAMALAKQPLSGL